jgi:hypothetical protein
VFVTEHYNSGSIKAKFDHTTQPTTPGASSATFQKQFHI